MAARKQSVDPRRNSRKQQQSQHDAVEKKYRLVDEESEVDTKEEQSHEDMAIVSVDAENEVDATDDESDGIPSDVGELDDKKCPSCRRSYGTNRVLRNDPNMDSIIEVVIGDISKYDAEILASTLEQVRQQQPVTVTEDINNVGNTSAGTSAKRLSNAQENAYARKRTRKPRTPKRSANQSSEIKHDKANQNEHQQDQVNENEIYCNKSDENKEDYEIMAEIMQLRSKRLKIFSQDSSTDTDLDGERNSSGGGGARNHRSSSVARRIKNTRLTILAKHLHLHGQKKKNNDQLEIDVKLVSLNRDVENPEKPHLFCSPALSFHLLREYVARGTPMRSNDIQLFVVEEANPDPNQASASRNRHTSLYQEVGYSNFDLSRQEDSHILAHCPAKNGNLIIAYGRKNIS
ncbi:hypothetical protein L6452_19351 [Arctium lappa]|uniref:Uncharacterized protein n=1 Tax=Arctium lappa TaxID=4217 RepID=A0ACB9B7M6_ARCLA|nr:hypothetical protein L6452_19351 [Arctium lappa]